MLLARQWLMATAESCTGGWVAQALTAIPGSSAWFERGLVTYSNQAKQDLLQVPAEILDHYGAVSEATARAMVQGLLNSSPVQFAIAVTGIAGPSGGSADKPVGTVWFAWGSKQHCQSAKCQFAGNRKQIRQQSVTFVLQAAIDFLQALVIR